MARARFAGLALIVGVFAGCRSQMPGAQTSPAVVPTDTLDEAFVWEYPRISLALTLLYLLPHAPEYQDSVEVIFEPMFRHRTFRKEVARFVGQNLPVSPQITKGNPVCDQKMKLDQDISRFYVALAHGQACLYAFVRTERVDSRGRGTYTAYMDAAWDRLAFASQTYDNAY